MTIDGGALVISPPALRVRPRVGIREATGEMDAATGALPGTVDPSTIGLGFVHLSPALHKTVHLGVRVLVWVAVIDPPPAVSCHPVPDPPGPRQPSLRVIVIAVSGRKAVLFTSRGTGDCGGPIHSPSVAVATEVVSIPWRGVANTQLSTSPSRYIWQISYQLPRCGDVFDYGVSFLAPGSPTIYVQAMVPVVPSSPCGAPRTTTVAWGPEPVPVSLADHAALGVTPG